MEVPVVRGFVWKGLAYRPGETILVEAIEAAAMSRRGYVSLTKGYAAKVEAPAGKGRRARVTAAGDAGVKRQYRRKDLIPEP